MYAITQKIGGGGFAIVGGGQRFEFPAEDGPLIADLLDSEWPECERCGDRGCPYCDRCYEAGCNCACPEMCEECGDDLDEGVCPSCTQDEDGAS